MPWTVRMAVAGLGVVAGSAVHAKSVETRVLGGVSIHEYTHGVVNLGIRKDELSAEWLTDTLDLRWSPDLERGRAWVAVRGELGAVGLMISPWEAGRPVREQGFAGAYYGGEGGVVRYLRHGLYVGTAASGTSRERVETYMSTTGDQRSGRWGSAPACMMIERRKVRFPSRSESCS